ncbi:PREDICTED: olfactory receptor 5V1-like [Nanorana parkeri]|uniref:olfactory receptor 5V1-like n=1 Tax=Nanorana parkeri TaxID=125878 RepID=UPI0008542CA3|nr:PREDICTED: olfactory receptor 5V1-like [Nanorana parkeri]
MSLEGPVYEPGGGRSISLEGGGAGSAVSPRLQTPIYFFLLTTVLGVSSTIVPGSQDRGISFLGCASQMYFSLALGATECIILAVMAYDRYVAICIPLRYQVIMRRSFCLSLAALSWTVSFLNSVIHAVLTFRLPYCKSNLVRHFFCEMPPLFRLSCSDTLFNEVAVYISVGLIALCSFLLTLTSYFHIISTILTIGSNKGRSKVFSTCGSHLAVVSLYYGAIAFMYLRPRSSYSPDRDRAISMLYTVVTPMLNPVIYSIRNKEVKGSLKRRLAMRRSMWCHRTTYI